MKKLILISVSLLSNVFSFAQAEVYKDSFNYYFQEDWVLEAGTGNLLICSLPEPNDSIKITYFYVDSDTTLVLVKSKNLNNGTLTAKYFRAFNVNSYGGKCWFPDLVWVEYDNSGNVQSIEYFNGGKDNEVEQTLKPLKFSNGKQVSDGENQKNER